MHLHTLLLPLETHPGVRAVVESVRPGRTPSDSRPALLSTITPARPPALATFFRQLPGPLLLITGRPGEARHYADELCAWLPNEDDVLLFPETDALPYDRLPNDADKLAQRLHVLRRLAGVDGGARPLVVASVRAALDLLIDPRAFRDRHRLLRRGERVAPAELAAEWLRLGYEPAPLVDQPGLFSRRGGILDVFPPGGRALRLDFWGDEIDTVRVFDAATQRTVETVDAAWVGPAHEVLPAPLPRPLETGSLRREVRDGFERDLRLLEEGQGFPTLELYRGFSGSATIADYLPGGAVLALEDPDGLARTAEEFERQVEQLHADLLERGEVPPGIAQPYRSWPHVAARLPRGTGIVAVGFDPDAESLPFQHAPKLAGQLPALIDRADRAERRLVVVSQQAQRLREVLREQGISVAESVEEVTSERRVAVVQGLLKEGWRSDALDLELLTDGEVFGYTKQRRAANRRTAERSAAARDQFIADLNDGDFVVHEDHGIGRFRGLIRQAIGFQPGAQGPRAGAPPGSAEFLLLEYAAGDRLYVPVSQADRVGRYVGSGDQQPTLTRLGTGEWSRAKAKVRRSVRDIARELMDLYAARRAVEKEPYPDDTTWQQELEASFPYEETPDQARAIQDVKQDLSSPKPMDRLLVGDVGFGKTEVALRAAFKAVQNGKQVAVLVPTTVLAQQHFNTFKDRLGPFPVAVEMLSRFRSEKEQQTVLKGLANGSVDICIGTHRLVQKDVQFKSLGLVVIDEEQRFGVTHKERLKQLRKEVDVLTLTATPIPRTLHMGLVGVRDMSLLETAPEARLPVRTYVAEYEDGLVREAILREIDRGGQVYFVHNRVQGIETVANRIRRLVPDASVLVAHGQMPEDQLEAAMLQFAEGECDVLVCTTIIESGLDIPNANTLIVNNAHRFGLAQLYQLRGRVGRSSARAYAYFLFTREMALTEIASERLKTIFEATELGAGMRIAMKDLEIRGAGNLLGAAQSGHIASVGFDLYTRLLAEQVELLKMHESGLSGVELARRLAESAAALDLPLDAYIPTDFVVEDELRLRLYQRFAAVSADQELADLVTEVEDRFGKLPEPTQQMVYLASLRLRAQQAGVEQISATDDEIVVKLTREPPLDVPKMEREVGTPLKRFSNQVRMQRGKSQDWTGPLYVLVDLLAQRAVRP